MNMQTNTINPTLAAIEAQAMSQGYMGADGFFAMSDDEFALDTLHEGARDALEAHITNSKFDPETAAFLREFMVQSREVHIEPLLD